MSFKFSNLNKGNKFTFKPEKDFSYISLKELLQINKGDLEVVYPVRALYVNKSSKFGPQGLVALDECYVNLPKHMLEDVESIIDSEEAVEAVNAGQCGMKIRPYEDRNGRDQLSIDWVDINA